MIPKEMIEAAARAPKLIVRGNGVGNPWVICRDDDRAVIVEEAAGSLADAEKRCAFLNAEAALTAALSSQWREMESAPRDGTWILLWNELWTETLGVVTGSWDDVHGTWTTESISMQSWDKEDWPTHWMPLPAPPEEKAE